jgi:hypothetical protein
VKHRESALSDGAWQAAWNLMWDDIIAKLRRDILSWPDEKGEAILGRPPQAHKAIPLTKRRSPKAKAA